MAYKGTLSNGFRYSIENDVFDDYEILELIADVEDNPTSITKLVTLILGEKQKNNLIKYLKNKEGKARLSTMERLMGELFQKLQKDNENLKN